MLRFVRDFLQYIFAYLRPFSFETNIANDACIFSKIFWEIQSNASYIGKFGDLGAVLNYIV
jgi:hypothetical protein